ncbi:hypothetical protein [Roseivivax isoporae]|uniref:Uncharacterized protein n=1 Tax=Roseivivax isoporae LMG 25204 TaxID=1449351 RepID=X7F3F2_9RHOB|nr:hypothetical protein [Roseivivax isoporae]ETX27340.1 hypothetical protein RISW2_14680 [Roseivivax isoporae LMG 25204]
MTSAILSQTRVVTRGGAILGLAVELAGAWGAYDMQGRALTAKRFETAEEVLAWFDSRAAERDLPA